MYDRYALCRRAAFLHKVAAFNPRMGRELRMTRIRADDHFDTGDQTSCME
jgi:hypothetical protein